MAKDSKIKDIAKQIVKIIKLLKQKINGALRNMSVRIAEFKDKLVQKAPNGLPVKINPNIVSVFEKVSSNVLASNDNFSDESQKFARMTTDAKNILDKEKDKRIKEINVSDAKNISKKIVNVLKQIVQKLNVLERVAISNDELDTKSRTNLLARIKSYKDLFSISMGVFNHIVNSKINIEKGIKDASIKEVEKVKKEACLDPGYADDGGKQREVGSLDGNADYADDGGKQREVGSLDGNADYADDGGKQLQVSLEELINDANRLLNKIK